MHRVVIIGGGFGGLYAAKALKRAPVEVTLVDRRNFHLFQPLLYQVATGALSPGEIASPLRAVLKRQRNARVLLAEVNDVDVERRRVLLRPGPAPAGPEDSMRTASSAMRATAFARSVGSDGEVEYDTLIVATGARHHYFGHSDWERVAPGLKTIEDATEIRARILFAFEAAEREPDAEARRSWLTFVIIGAGPTGVELAGAIGEIANDTLKRDFRSIDSRDAHILLLEGADRVLPPYPADLSTKAAAALGRLGVTVRTGATVTEVDADGVTVHSGETNERLAARTVLWAAGVQASRLGRVLAERAGATLDRVGRVVVEPDLSIAGHCEILVIGDLASFSHQTGKPLPGVAPVAMQEGRYAARLVEQRLAGATLAPFHYVDRGSLATIGRAAAVADFGRVRFDGLLAWLAWLFIHLLYLIEFDNRLLVLVQWAWNYFTRNRGARLITGETHAARGRRADASVSRDGAAAEPRAQSDFAEPPPSSAASFPRW
jgi:NADH dehydrogenase